MEETLPEREGSPDNEHEEQIKIEDVQVDTPQNTGDTDERITSEVSNLSILVLSRNRGV